MVRWTTLAKDVSKPYARDDKAVVLVQGNFPYVKPRLQAGTRSVAVSQAIPVGAGLTNWILTGNPSAVRPQRGVHAGCCVGPAVLTYLDGTGRSAGPSYVQRYWRGIGPLLRPPCCVCSQACARMPTERDRQNRPRASGAGKPSSA